MPRVGLVSIRQATVVESRSWYTSRSYKTSHARREGRVPKGEIGATRSIEYPTKRVLMGEK